MKFSKFMTGSNKSYFNVVLGLGLLVVIVVLFNYNTNKSSILDNMESPEHAPEVKTTLNMAPSNRDQDLTSSSFKDNFLPVSGTPVQPATNQNIVNPSDLLPKDINSDWSNVNPANSDLKNINLLSAGQLIGINTVGSSLRNPNLQERSEPVIPKAAIGPWNNSTIDADNLRRPLEIGGEN